MFVVQFAVISVRSDRPEDWVPEEGASVDYDDCNKTIEILSASADKEIVDIFAVHSYHNAGMNFLFLYSAY
jgi:magnesium/proton exchanger